MPAKTKRLIAAVLLTPLFIGLVAGVIGLLMGGWKLAGYFSAATALAALIFIVIYGVPVHLILKRLGRTGILYYLAASLPAALILERLNAEYVGLQIAFDAMPGGIISPLTLILASAVTATIAWTIARPDKSATAKAAL